jgi:hypothetical protein
MMPRSKTIYAMKGLVIVSVFLMGTFANSVCADEKQDSKNQPNRQLQEQRDLQKQLDMELVKRTKAVQEMSEKFKQMQMQLADREAQLKMISKQIVDQQSRPALPPLENAQIKLFTLLYAPARDAAHTIETLLGTHSMRVAVDDRTNTLIVYGKADSTALLEALLERIDRAAAPASRSEKAKQAGAAPRSLLVRMFWLADGVRDGSDPADFLPQDVLRAANKVGLEEPRLVTQTVNSLAISRDEVADFQTNVPAILAGEPNLLSCDGRLKMIGDDHVRLDMGVRVGFPKDCNLKGSLTSPLGHYMVLGTANWVMPDFAAAGANVSPFGMAPGRMAPRGAARPRGPEAGPAGPEASGAGPEGSAPGAFGGYVAAGAALVAPGGAAEPQLKPNIKTSRFAFVVQVIEGESYAAKKSKSDNLQKAEKDPVRE